MLLSETSRSPTIGIRMHKSTVSSWLRLFTYRRSLIRAVPKAEELVAEAEKAEQDGDREKASEFYM